MRNPTPPASSDCQSHLLDCLLSWFADHGRDLPWRKEYQPYQVWISEIMAQQTQMDRVVVYFQRWMRELPTVAAVAGADEQRILKLWEGLGYYRRARHIHRAAQIMVALHGGRVPDTREALLALPGIGVYTAAAILSIAFNQPIPLADANVQRIAARLIDIDTPIAQAVSRRRVEVFVSGIFPLRQARHFNQALMELGALVCTPKNPSCWRCPVQECCRAFRLDVVDQRPVPGKKPVILRIDMACAVIFHQGCFYIQQRLPDDVWAGLWEFPGGRIRDGEDPTAAAVRETLEETGLAVQSLHLLDTVRHSHTRYRITLHAFACILQRDNAEPVLHAASQYRWARPKELPQFAFPAGHRQLLPLLLSPDIRKKFR